MVVDEENVAGGVARVCMAAQAARVCGLAGSCRPMADSSNAGLSALRWMNKPYRWQASSHRCPFQQAIARWQSRLWKPPVGAGLPAIAVVTPIHSRQAERWPVSPEVDEQALSLASQLPQVPISSRQSHDGKAACVGAGLPAIASGPSPPASRASPTQDCVGPSDYKAQAPLHPLWPSATRGSTARYAPVRSRSTRRSRWRPGHARPVPR